MLLQRLPSGEIQVGYGESVEYQSPLWIISSCKTEVVYSEKPDGQPIARVYKKDGEWYLSSGYLGHWQPVPTLTKYDGFLLLLRLYKSQKEGK
jgi:hypothetical protein